MALPVLLLARYQCFWGTAVCIAIHDVLDRLDGAIAVSQKERGIKRTGDLINGAFFDAMVDKVFGMIQLVALMPAAQHCSMGAVWFVMWAKMCVLF